MKKGIHPETYRLVAFKDMSNDTVFVTRSCAPSKETITVEGVEYPLVKLEISNTSHPFPNRIQSLLRSVLGNDYQPVLARAGLAHVVKAI